MNNRLAIPLLASLLYSFGCSEPQEKSFDAWQKKRESVAQKTTTGITYTQQITSDPLKIDTILRSMQGPAHALSFEFDTKEELLWLTGYSGKVIAAEADDQLPNAYLCHNNLDTYGKDNTPWRSKTPGAGKRVFTLTGGQTSFSLPDGFGIPISPKQEFAVFSQVLNHNDRELNIEVRQQVDISYKKDSETSEPIIPLYQQAIYLTKQYEGPYGAHGHSLLCKEQHLDEDLRGEGVKHGKHKDCSVDFDKAVYNPLEDEYGRKFSAHWKLPNEKEILTSDVSRLMNLEFDTKIHAIGTHVHPFCDSLQLWDITSDSLLYTCHVTNSLNEIGLNKIPFYSTTSGIDVYKDHQYKMMSYYNCTDSTEKHTAMAVMFLYLWDKE